MVNADRSRTRDLNLGMRIRSDVSFGPSRHDKCRTRRVMMLSNAVFIVGDLDGPASRLSPAFAFAFCFVYEFKRADDTTQIR